MSDPKEVACDSPRAMPTLAVVVIGRNGGERLVRCLKSLQGAAVVVYVDSGSSDGSPERARALGADVVILRNDVPFTAARARNTGFARAKSICDRLDFVQFVDGDCEVCAGWLDRAAAFLRDNVDTAAVCGRRRERFPERSIYNELCDLEWEVAPGEATYFGGDVMIRAAALGSVGGYRDALIAGEEPELALRLRRAGWRLQVLPGDMTLHDAAMTRFGQWWRRMRRSGYAYAAGAWLHGRSVERHWVWQAAQGWLWVPLPLGVLVLAAPLVGIRSVLILAIYPMQMLRLFFKSSGTLRSRLLQSSALTIVRFPEFQGQLQYLRDALHGRSELIEYK
jgi:GT2 family glycosyltransferase